MELTLSHELSQLDQKKSFYTDDELELLDKLEKGLVETKSHDQVMENLRKKLGLTEK
ncbi:MULTISPECIES: hypothetical protein [Mannheimia]|uniref:hypothetical protein n=1 Tax=Mannheimia TaxID=75984 RepID=UPI00186410FE|nr:hypothetical protein [Mannheimia pernigra]